MAAPIKSQELIDQLLHAEKEAEGIISTAKKNRLNKLRQAKGDADEDVKAFYKEAEAKFQAETLASTQADQTSNLNEVTKREIEKVQKDYETNKGKAIDFIVNAVMDVSIGLSTTQKQALNAGGPPALSTDAEARLKKVLAGNRVAIVTRSLSTLGKAEEEQYEAKLDLKEKIEFKAVHHGDNLETHCAYSHEDKSKHILGDVAEILKLYPKAMLTIEGHTATPDEKMDQWAQDLAQSRADKVKDTIVSFGIESGRLSTRGCPGNRGSGKHETVLKVTSF